ncbi:MAG: DUF998 domain-containing protein [Phycisphaerales bacterium]|nr:DUF998 domain-containing protein [Hyphomonadaceae bacterium]
MKGKFAMICGVLGALWLIGMVIAGGATFPDYDHAAQYISELGATGAPFGRAVSWAGFLPVGILISLFAVFGWLSAPRSVWSALGFVGVFVFAVGYTGSAFFPCDYGCRPEEPTFSQAMHYLVGLPGYFFAPLTLVLLAVAALRWPRAKYLAVLGIICAAGALAALTMMSPDFAYVGLAQRALEASMLIWVVACALYLGATRAHNKTAAP